MSQPKPNTKRKNTEGAIMAAAEELFLERGYLLATTTEIARQAGVTHAMLHYYFQTKEQIFFKVLDKNLHEMFASMRQAMSAEAVAFWPNLKGGVTRLLEYLDQHRQLVSFLYNVARHKPELLNRYRESTVSLISGLVTHHKMLLDSEVQAGRCNPITFEQLFLDIVSLSFSTYMSVPVMEQAVGMSREEIDRALKKRHDEIIALLYYRLYGRCEPDR